MERGVPLELISTFDSDDWVLMTAEVDDTKGEFISSAWIREINGRTLWVVIGLGNSVKTIIEKDSNGINDEIVQSGTLYEHVAAVNQKLICQENI